MDVSQSWSLEINRDRRCHAVMVCVNMLPRSCKNRDTLIPHRQLEHGADVVAWSRELSDKNKILSFP